MGKRFLNKIYAFGGISSPLGASFAIYRDYTPACLSADRQDRQGRDFRKKDNLPAGKAGITPMRILYFICVIIFTIGVIIFDFPTTFGILSHLLLASFFQVSKKIFASVVC